MFEYLKNRLGIREKVELENAKADIAELDKLSGDAMSELGEVASDTVDATLELAEMVADLEQRLTALENN